LRRFPEGLPDTNNEFADAFSPQSKDNSFLKNNVAAQQCLILLR